VTADESRVNKELPSRIYGGIALMAPTCGAENPLYFCPLYHTHRFGDFSCERTISSLARTRESVFSWIVSNPDFDFLFFSQFLSKVLCLCFVCWSYCL